MKEFKRFISQTKKIPRFATKTLVEGRLDKKEKNFIAHNKKVWGQFLPKDDNGEILVELNSMASSIIAFSYLANLLAQMHQAKIVGYQITRRFGALVANRKTKKIFQSFNVGDFVGVKLSPSQRQKAEKLFEAIGPQLKTKKDVEDLQVEGLWIGDLLYDSHCMEHRVPTVEIGSHIFRDSLKQALCAYVFWQDHLDVHRVSAVIVTHTVYVGSGVLLRLAIQRGIPAYQINATHLYFLTKENLWAYNDFFYYPEKFRELPEEERQKGLLAAKERLQMRFSGEVGVDMHYSTKSAYGRIKPGRVLKESPRLKILVATHCFFDSPHPFGVNLFPDFYEWLSFLGEISERTDYDWYIKMHPDFLPGNVPIIEEFIRKYPKFTLIPSETSHLQLKEEGINFGLTVCGTIGFEYAALGIPLINASRCNPHIRYHFNLHPQSIEEYEEILMNMSNQKLVIDINEVYEYYYMAFVNNTDNWLFKDYEAFIKEIGGYYSQFESISYEKFIAKYNDSEHTNILTSLRNFVESKDYHFRKIYICTKVLPSNNGELLG
jgi:hypothetical protein